MGLNAFSHELIPDGVGKLAPNACITMDWKHLCIAAPRLALQGSEGVGGLIRMVSANARAALPPKLLNGGALDQRLADITTPPKTLPKLGVALLCHRAMPMMFHLVVPHLFPKQFA